MNYKDQLMREVPINIVAARCEIRESDLRQFCKMWRLDYGEIVAELETEYEIIKDNEPSK